MRPCPPDMQSGPGSLVSEATPYLNWLVGNKTNQANLGDDLSPEAFCTGTVKTDSYMACLLATRLALNLRGLKHSYPEAFVVAPPAE